MADNTQRDRFQCLPSPLTFYPFPPQSVPHIDHHTGPPALPIVIHPSRRSFGAVEVQSKTRLPVPDQVILQLIPAPWKSKKPCHVLISALAARLHVSLWQHSPGPHPENTVIVHVYGHRKQSRPSSDQPE